MKCWAAQYSQLRSENAHLFVCTSAKSVGPKPPLPTDQTKVGFFTNSKSARSNQTVTVTSNGQQTEPASALKYLLADISEIGASASLPYKE